MDWLLFAFGSAVFAGLTAVLSKIGVRDTDSDLATAVRTAVVLVFSWIMVFLTAAEFWIWIPKSFPPSRPTAQDI